ncbi:DDE-type integrase/transposase/recombinase, partial [Streptomyces sp. NPDC127044]
MGFDAFRGVSPRSVDDLTWCDSWRGVKEVADPSSAGTTRDRKPGSRQAGTQTPSTTTWGRLEPDKRGQFRPLTPHVAESGYSAWRDRPPSNRLVKHAWLTETIVGMHTASRGTYGSRRVHAELGLGLGIHVSHGAVELLMHHAGLHGLPGNRRRRTKHLTPSVADLVERNFTRQARDRLWVTDITEHPTFEGKVYCAVVLDAFSRRVVGWSIDASPTAALTTSALAVATGNRSPRPGGTIIHSDHGVQCESRAFTP